MMKADYPTVEEVAGYHWKRTVRGEEFLKKLAKQIEMNPVTLRDKIRASHEALYRCGEKVFPKPAPYWATAGVLATRNVLITRYEKNVPVFVPLVDPF